MEPLTLLERLEVAGLGTLGPAVVCGLLLLVIGLVLCAFTGKKGCDQVISVLVYGWAVIVAVIFVIRFLVSFW